jgi:pimeloyl-ACP methyl ester carboxylesterase
VECLAQRLARGPHQGVLDLIQVGGWCHVDAQCYRYLNERPPSVPMRTSPWREDGWVLLQDARPLIVCSIGEQRVRASFEQFLTDFDVEDRLGEIQMPTLITAAGQNQVIPLAHSERLRAGIPQAQFVVLPDSGHGDVAEGSADGQQWCAAIQRFLERLTKLDRPTAG